MSTKHQLPELQLAIMHVLWEREEATVGAVRDALEIFRPLAYTTVGTMLTKMEEKGLVGHRIEGRVNVYRPLVPREQVSRSMVADLADRLYRGDVAQMVCHLLDGDSVTREDLAEMKRLIRRRERELKDDH
jgi:BlaI family transcriptional regulator, penicillinase repressor